MLDLEPVHTVKNPVWVQSWSPDSLAWVPNIGYRTSTFVVSNHRLSRASFFLFFLLRLVLLPIANIIAIESSTPTPVHSRTNATTSTTIRQRTIQKIEAKPQTDPPHDSNPAYTQSAYHVRTWKPATPTQTSTSSPSPHPSQSSPIE